MCKKIKNNDGIIWEKMINDQNTRKEAVNYVHQPCKKENGRYAFTRKNRLWLQKSNHIDDDLGSAFHYGYMYVICQSG